ncbi:MAG: 16S rRNA (uracil(1498)-N(3))-methyltransferase [Flavobacteriales bacterium]|nr:16S rRNA (uracil(1498)-N(3))-methyltransferase [Flavobacteriales bacterium]|tara:strand:- start:28220 stop:28912 length:693 start_codon:yes stop_codon:yes gene_type:complete
MQLFYTNSTENYFTLNPEESKHVTKVLRKKKGDRLNFTDGKGNLLMAEILISDIRKTTVEVIKKEKKIKQHKYYLHVAIAPTKNMDRFEWFLEKACELGIDEITPIICSHSERKIIKADRCNRILLSAMKQSLKFHKPKLNNTISIENLLRNDFQGNKYIAHCKEAEKIELKNQKTENRTLILIGPEGDFSDNEIAIAIEKKFKAISLGTSRLRTETAGIAAVHTINIKQ